MGIEETALEVISKHEEGVFQNKLWKELDIDSRKCSRVIAKLLKDADHASLQWTMAQGPSSSKLPTRKNPVLSSCSQERCSLPVRAAGMHVSQSLVKG